MNINDQNKETETTETETQSDFDMEAATADISADLFGQDESTEAKEKPAEGEGETGTAGTETGDEQASPPQQGEKDAKEKEAEGEAATKETESSEAVQATGAPKTWTKEALEKWATVDPLVQKEILKREDDFLKGITQYKAAADLGVKYSKVIEPYAPILAAENVDPVGLFQSFAANHYLLSRGTEDQKLQLAAQLIHGYQIPFDKLATFIGEQVIAPADPEIAALRKELNDLKSGMTFQQTAALEKSRETIQAEVNAFADDKEAHPYFDEVADAIGNFMKSGSAQSLQEAYDMAVYANPVTRQKEIDRLTTEKLSSAAAEEKARKDKIAASTAANVKADSHNRNGTEPLGTMDETLQKTYEAIQSRG